MKALRWIYPSMVGLLLGQLQTGLFFQLSFTLSSSYRTFLMVTVCWLLGSVIGTRIAAQVRLQLNGFTLLALCAYFACVLVLGAAPFNSTLWPLYAGFIALAGLYPGVFFVRLGEYYSARELFLKENNGFIVGLISGTILFLVLGRTVLWAIPVVIAVIILFCTNRFLSQQCPLKAV